MKRTIAQEISMRIVARANCIENDNQNWISRHEDSIESLIERLPSGSGIDYGTSIDYSSSTLNKIVLNSACHVTSDDGYHASIIDYRIVITASLQFGINVNVIGNFSSNRDAYGVKEYLLDMYDSALREDA